MLAVNYIMAVYHYNKGSLLEKMLMKGRKRIVYQETKKSCWKCLIQGPTNTFFFEYFLKFLFFYLRTQSFRLITKNNFIQMTVSAGQAVAYTMVPIFKHIIACVQRYYTNGFMNIVIKSVNCLWASSGLFCQNPHLL